MTLPLAVPTDSIRAAMRTIDAGGKGIALVVDSTGRLLDTVTDGDLRRAVLAGLDLDGPVSGLLATKPCHSRPHPVTAPAGTDPSVLMMLMREWHVRQVPLLDLEGRVVGLVTTDDLISAESLPLTAVVMAGGFGTRLRPLTDTCPKPMLPVGDRPLLEHTLRRLREAGIRQVAVTTHHLAEQIEGYFGDGSALGLDVRYIREDHPLGNAGALGLLEMGDEPLLVLNGDLLCSLDFRAMLEYHREQCADLTMAVRRKDWEVGFGVVDVDGARVLSLTEKPIATLLINCGIYLVSPTVRQLIRPEPMHMPDVVEMLLKAGRPVAAFGMKDTETWVDIGTPKDYDRAQREVQP